MRTWSALIGAMLLLVTAGLARAAPSPLVGAWQLVSAAQMRPDGTTKPLAFITGSEGAKGLIIYTTEGVMSVQIAGAGRPKGVNSGSGTVRAYPPEVAQAVLGSYYGYFGRYTVDPAQGMVKHIITQSLHPDEAGITYERHYTVEGDTLTLETEPFDIEGERRYNQLVWKRVR